MRYFYARVSTQEQDLARQLAAARSSFKGEYDEVFCDKKSGRNFDRPQYQAMKQRLVKGDELVIKSLDRLGRNKAALQEEVRWMKEHGILLRILDVPTTLMEYPEGQEWVFEMVNNILLEVLSAIAQQELELIRSRTKEGLAALPVDEDGYRYSPRTGQYVGHPVKYDRDAFYELYSEVKKGKITNVAACAKLGISRRQWFRLKAQLE